jgi:hypothetical protein
MADPTTLTAVIGGATLVIGGVATAFWNSFFSKSGAMERDLRTGLAEEVERQGQELRALRREFDILRSANSRLYEDRERARILLRLAEQRLAEPITQWPPDPPPPGGSS